MLISSMSGIARHEHNNPDEPNKYT